MLYPNLPFIFSSGRLSRPSHWQQYPLNRIANRWCQKMRQHIGAASEYSCWWVFIARWSSSLDNWIEAFRTGTYRFSPLIQYRFNNESIRVWSYRDRLMIHLLLPILRPTFKHIISARCLHLRGPWAIKEATQQLQAALQHHSYDYILRLDIRSYYASIQHTTLLSQLFKHYQDPWVRHYLTAIVTAGIDKDAQVWRPEHERQA